MSRKHRGKVLNVNCKSKIQLQYIIMEFNFTLTIIVKPTKKSPEVIAKEKKKMNFKTKICARTIRNNIYAGDIYDIKPTDMIYNKEYKEKNKEKNM